MTEEVPCPQPRCDIPFQNRDEVITHLQWGHNLSELEAERRLQNAE